MYSTLKSGQDQVSGIPVSVIYDMLNRSTNSLEDLKAKLIARYPKKNKNKEITLLFSYYGYESKKSNLAKLFL